MVKFHKIEYNKLRDAFTLFGFIKKFEGKTLLIKPNWVYPEKQSCTDIRLIKEIVKFANLFNVKKVILAESGYIGLENVYEKLFGLKELEKKWDGFLEVRWLEKGDNKKACHIEKLKQYESLAFVKIFDVVKEVDVILNVPKLKCHAMCRYTGAIKNMMGLMRAKGNMHPRASEKILYRRLPDLYSFYKENFDVYTIIDGIDGAEYAEVGGIQAHVGYLIESDDMWEADVGASRLIGMDPTWIKYLKNIGGHFNREDLFPPEVIPFEEALLYQEAPKYAK